MSNKHIYYDGIKSNILWDEETDAWVYMSGKPVGEENPHAYYKAVPTLFRSVDIRASSVANLPWAIMKGENEYESSLNYENKTGLVKNMYNMLYLIEAALVLTGRAYWKRETNPAGYKKIRHLEPNSLQLDEKRATNGELVWKRNENGKVKEYTTDEIIYFWALDPFTEIGPPSSWPVKAALNACGVLANMDEFAKNYFGRGAIKAMIFSMSGASRETAEEFEHWWSRYFAGIRNAFRTKVVNSDAVSPVIVGEGIKELENVTLSQEKREEIALATGIPMSILFANAANYATAGQDKKNWYDDLIVPEANFIAAILNEQVYEPLGLRLVFQPETLDIYQEDETKRAEAMSNFVDAVVKAKTLEMAQAMFIIYGVEVSDEAMALIEAHFEKKDEITDQISGQMEPRETVPETEPPEVRSQDLQQIRHELSIWQDKCLSAVKKGKPASSVAFIPAAISADVFERVTDGLVDITDADTVKGVFTSALIERPDPPTNDNAIMELVEAIREQNNIAVWKGYP